MEELIAANEARPPDELYNVSIKALRCKTRDVIAALLNPRKIILTDNGLPRDWHGLADLIGIRGEHIPSMGCGSNPTRKLLDAWYEKDKVGSTIKQLLIYLEELDRCDIIADAKPLVDEDIKIFQSASESKAVDLFSYSDENILTIDDLNRNGLEFQRYDAFLLFAEEDADFATTVIDKLENQYKLKLCAKDRDLVVGVFQHDSIITLIKERCNRLIVIISPAFLESSSNKFFCSFAQSLGIEQRQRKIIPCLYAPCDVPPELSCYFMLNYQRATRFANFWERLRDAIKVRPGVDREQNMQRSVSQQIHPIQEIKENGCTKPSLDYDNSNTLKPKKEGVKFSSMINLNSTENDAVIVDQNLNPASSASSLTITANDAKKTKIKPGWLLKKLLPHKSEKCNHTVIEEIPERHKKGFFSRHAKRKVAMAN